jgi:hypothetical protein
MGWFWASGPSCHPSHSGRHITPPDGPQSVSILAVIFLILS